jgi:transposase
VFFTELDLDAEAMVRKYDERWRIEKDFRWVKEVEVMMFFPLFVRKDASTLAHAFLVVLGLMLCGRTFRKLRQAGVKAKNGEIHDALDELKVALVRQRQGGKLRGGHGVLEERGPLAE